MPLFDDDTKHKSSIRVVAVVFQQPEGAARRDGEG